MQLTADLRDVVVERDYVRQQRDSASAELSFLRSQYDTLVGREKSYVVAHE